MKLDKVLSNLHKLNNEIYLLLDVASLNKPPHNNVLIDSQMLTKWSNNIEDTLDLLIVGIVDDAI